MSGFEEGGGWRQHIWFELGNGVVSGNVHRRLKFWIGSVVAVEMLLKDVFGMNSRRSCVICGGSSCICGGSCATQQTIDPILQIEVELKSIA